MASRDRTLDVRFTPRRIESGGAGGTHSRHAGRRRPRRAAGPARLSWCARVAGHAALCAVLLGAVVDVAGRPVALALAPRRRSWPSPRWRCCGSCAGAVALSGRALALLAIVAGALVVPFLVWPLAPGWRNAARVGVGLLVSWRDGWPALVPTAAAGNAVRASGCPRWPRRDPFSRSGRHRRRCCRAGGTPRPASSRCGRWPRLPPPRVGRPSWPRPPSSPPPRPRGRTRRPRRCAGRESAASGEIAAASPPPSRRACAAAAWPSIVAAACRAGPGRPCSSRARSRARIPAIRSARAHGPGTALVLALPLAVRRGALRFSRDAAAGALAAMLIAMVLAGRGWRRWPRWIAAGRAVVAAARSAVIIARLEPPLDGASARPWPGSVTCAPAGRRVRAAELASAGFPPSPAARPRARRARCRSRARTVRGCRRILRRLDLSRNADIV